MDGVRQQEDFIVVQVARLSADSLDSALEQMKDAGTYLSNANKGTSIDFAVYGSRSWDDLPHPSQVEEVKDRLAIAQ